MELKDVVYQNFGQIRSLFLGTFISVSSLILRIRFTQDLYLSFLGWNLMLAFVPFVITLYLYKHSEILAHKWKRTGISIIWLLFLPNAPYIITDFIHLSLADPDYLVLDFLVIASFATTGFLSAIYSIHMLRTFYGLFYSPRTLRVLTFTICALSGFGVYLGRFIRLNSWDIIARPWLTINGIFNGLAHPLAWTTTLVIGALLQLALIGFNKKSV